MLLGSLALLALAGWSVALMVIAISRNHIKRKNKVTGFVQRILTSVDYVSDQDEAVNLSREEDLRRQIEQGRRAKILLSGLQAEVQNAYRNILIEQKDLYEQLEGKDKLMAFLGKIHTLVELEQGLHEQIAIGDRAFEEISGVNDEMPTYVMRR